MKHRLIKLSKLCLIISLIFLSNPIYATDNQKDKKEINTTKYAPVTINYLLEGVDTKLKSSKVLDGESDFWDDYTIKLTNKLVNGSIDIQDKIRDYYFSHYEINGRRIESIDAILNLKEDTEINVIYSEEKQTGGYLRKGFENGIAIDFPYIEYISSENSEIHSELYDETWMITFPSEYCLEIKDRNKDLVNANDKTLYLNIDTRPLSTKEETDLTKKYNYIDSIKITSSLDYSDTKSTFLLKYTPVDTVMNFKNKEIILNGVNFEGKVEEITTSVFDTDSVEFIINKNLNNYKYIFLSIKNTTEIIDEHLQNSDNSIIKEENGTFLNENNLNLNNEDATTIVKNESIVIKIIMISFIVGSISTYILSLILSIRQENIKKKKEIKAQKEN